MPRVRHVLRTNRQGCRETTQLTRWAETAVLRYRSGAWTRTWRCRSDMSTISRSRTAAPQLPPVSPSCPWLRRGMCCRPVGPVCLGMPRSIRAVRTFSTSSRARRAPAGAWSRARQRVRRGEAAGVFRRGGRKHPRDSRRSRTGSSALAPAAHGGLPPGRDPGHRPSPVGRRYARRARLRGNGHPPGAPALSRPRSPSAAHDRACRKDGHERACSSAATPCPLHLPPSLERRL